METQVGGGGSTPLATCHALPWISTAANVTEHRLNNKNEEADM